jgi:hypothetical protein
LKKNICILSTFYNISSLLSSPQFRFSTCDYPLYPTIDPNLYLPITSYIHPFEQLFSAPNLHFISPYLALLCKHSNTSPLSSSKHSSPPSCIQPFSFLFKRCKYTSIMCYIHCCCFVYYCITTFIYYYY